MDTLRPLLSVSGPNLQAKTLHTPLTEFAFLQCKSYFQLCYNVHVVDFFFNQLWFCSPSAISENTHLPCRKSKESILATVHDD